MTSLLADVGDLLRTLGNTARALVHAPARAIARQLDEIAVRSLAVALLTAVFSGLVITVQFAEQLARFGAKEYVGDVVAVALVRELGPVLTALMVGGRVGAGITAELGSMAVGEQLDSMRTMCADPVEALVAPRVIAGVIALPALTLLADVVGVLSSVLMAAYDTHVRVGYFYSSIISVVDVSDVVGGLLKSVVFGLCITLIACNRGLRTRGGTEGVGRATTQTVVITSITTLVGDFVLTRTLMILGY